MAATGGWDSALVVQGSKTRGPVNKKLDHLSRCSPGRHSGMSTGGSSPKPTQSEGEGTSIPTFQWEESQGSHSQFLSLHGDLAVILSNSLGICTRGTCQQVLVARALCPGSLLLLPFLCTNTRVLHVQSIPLVPSKRGNFRWDLGGIKSHRISQCFPFGHSY